MAGANEPGCHPSFHGSFQLRSLAEWCQTDLLITALVTLHWIILFVFIGFNEVVWGGIMEWKAWEQVAAGLEVPLDWKVAKIQTIALCPTATWHYILLYKLAKYKFQKPRASLPFNPFLCG